MYNSIHPINITYRNPGQAYASQSYEQSREQTLLPDDKDKRNNQEFPNGTKVAIDYTKNTVNISQIVTDFKSTVIAIGAPEDVSDEVNSYLSLVERESKKANPSKEIIFSNLINASKISDKYIHQELSKKSGNAPKNVVEGWIDALFKQRVELKADPSHINPEFQLDIPDKNKKDPAPNETKSLSQINTPDEFVQKEQIHTAPEPFAAQISQNNQSVIESVKEEIHTVPPAEHDTPTLAQVVSFEQVKPEVPESPEAKDETQPQPAIQKSDVKKPSYITSDKDRVLSKSLKEAKNLLTLEDDPASALVLLNDALGEVDENTNINLRAALHFERGKIFDEYDYVNYALRDFYEATKCQDDNLKSQAHLKMARIYDDYVEFEPAVEHYQDAVGYSGEAGNLRAQSKILGEMASVYAGRFDVENTQMLNELSLDAARNTCDDLMLSYAYSNAAKNYEYIGEDFLALDCYKHAVKAVSNTPEDADLFEMRAQNYEDAANIMQKLGNEAKAESLLSKARLYRSRAELGHLSEAV